MFVNFLNDLKYAKSYTEQIEPKLFDMYENEAYKNDKQILYQPCENWMLTNQVIF